MWRLVWHSPATRPVLALFPEPRHPRKPFLPTCVPLWHPLWRWHPCGALSAEISLPLYRLLFSSDSTKAPPSRPQPPRTSRTRPKLNTLCFQLSAPRVPPNFQWMASLTETRITYLRRSAARRRSWRSSSPLHRSRPSGARADHEPPGSIPFGSGRLGLPRPARLRPTRIRYPVTSLLGWGRLGLPAEHSVRADSDPSVQSHHMTLTTAAPPGPGSVPLA